MASWGMFSLDSNFAATGGLPISSAQAVIRHVGVDTAVIETPYSEDAFARTAPGAGIMLQRDGRQEFAGLVGSERTMGWDSTSAVPTIKVSLLGYNVHLADRLSYPDPTRAGDDQTTNDYWIVTSCAASTALWRVIDQNLGPSARSERRLPGLTMGVDPAAGAFRSGWQLLFLDLLTAAEQLSILSLVNLGVRFVTQPGGGLVANIFVPADRSGDVRFSADLRNLSGFTFTETAPSCTYAIVAGQGDLHLRARKASTSVAPLDTRWGRRIEKYVDRRDEADLTILQQAADDEITQGAGQIAVPCQLVDTATATYGREYQLGDIVTVYVGLPGQGKVATVTDLVREISFEVDSSGAEVIRPAIGTTEAKAIRPGPSQEVLSDIGRRLSSIETRK